MTIGTLKKLIEPLEDGLPIIVVGEDGADFEPWFGVRAVTQELDPDAAEPYACVRCERLDDFPEN